MSNAAAAADQPVDSIYESGEVVGDAWSWLILREATLQDVCRFNEFQRGLGIARETLSSRLERLVNGGLLERRRAQPRRDVRYLLTPCGEDFFMCLATALRWGDDWCSEGGETGLAATHLACGEPFEAVLQCGACGDEIEAQQVEVQTVSRASSQLISSKRQRSPRLENLERVGPCSIARTLMVIGDRWSSLVVRECFLGTRRFDQFSTRLGVAPNILSNRLRRLVDHGVLVKTPYQTNPPRSEYRLTEKGIALYPVPLALLTWGDRWIATGERGIEMTHRPCAHALDAVLGCGRCSAPVERSEIEFVRAPASGAVS